MKKLVAWLLVCLMIVSSLPFAAFAASVDKGLCPGAGKLHNVGNCDEEKLYGPECGTDATTAGYKCKVCGVTFTAEEDAADDHEFVTIQAAVKSDCSQNKTGLTAKEQCLNCKKTIGGEVVAVHEDLDNEVEIIVDGKVYYAEGICDECGYATVTNNTAKPELLNHKWGNPVVTKLPTCSEYGKAVYTCTDPACDADGDKTNGYTPVTKEVAILKIACDQDNFVYVDKVDPTCTANGTKAHYICTADGCDRIYDVNKAETTMAALNIEKYNHDLSKAGMTDAHINHYVGGLGTVCEEDAETAKYDWVKVSDVTGKCGSYKRTCEICDAEYTKEISHNYVVDTEYGKDMPCDADNSKKEVCQICKDEKFSVRGHNYEAFSPAIKPTCLTEGKAAVVQCATCDETAYVSYDIAYVITTGDDKGKLASGAVYGVNAETGLGVVDWDGNGKFEGLELDAKFMVNANGKCVAPGHTETTLVLDNNGNTVIKSYCDTAKDYSIVYCANGAFCATYDAATQWVDDNGTEDTADDVTYSLTNQYDGTAIPTFDNFIKVVIAEEQTTHAATENFDYAVYLSKDEAGKAAYIAKCFWFAPDTGVGAWAVTTPATCSADGQWASYCTVCNKNVTGTIAQIDHKYVGKLYDTDATKEGMQPDVEKHWWSCEYCDQFDPDLEGAETKAHAFGTAKTNNTCKATTVTVNGVTYDIPAGATYEQCTDCGFVKVTANGFDYNKVYEHTPDNADTTDVNEYKSAYENAKKDHAGIAAEDDYYATINCETTGAYRTYECTDCNQMVFVSNAEGHLYKAEDGTVITAENAECCTEYTCFYCGEKNTFFEEHNWVYVPFKAPSCPVDLNGDGDTKDLGESGQGNLPYWYCDNTDGCKWVQYIDAAKGYEVVDGEIYKTTSTLSALNHKNEILDSATADDCASVGFDHVGCKYCNKYVNIGDLGNYQKDPANNWTYEWAYDEDGVSVAETWLDDAKNTDAEGILAAGEYIMNFTIGAHKNAAGEKFTSLCDAVEKGITDTKCVIAGCSGVAGHYEIGAEYTCTGYNCAVCGAPVEDATVAIDHIFGAYATDVAGEYAATGDIADFVEDADIITPEKSYQVCKFCGTEKKVWLEEDIENEIQYSLEVAPLYGTGYTLGSTIVVTIKVTSTGPVEIAGNQVTVVYDRSMVELYDFAAGEGSPFVNVTTAKASVQYTDLVAAMSATADGKNVVVDGEETVAVLYFTLHEGLSEEYADEYFAFETYDAELFSIVGDEDAPLTFASNENGDYEAKFVGFNTIHEYELVEIEIAPFLDLNEDGFVNTLDIIAALQYSAADYDERIDVDGDGIISAADIQDMLDCVAGRKTIWDLYTTGLPTYITDEINNFNSSNWI